MIWERGIVKPEWAGLAALLSVFLFSNAILAGQQQAGQIVGRVVNKTAEARGIPDQRVTLYDVTEDKEVVTPRTVRTDAEGRFVFDGLEASTEGGYVLSTDYEGASYSEGSIVFDEGEVEKEVELAVYDSTPRATHILVDQHHILVEPIADSLYVQEFLRVLNVGRETYVGVLTDSSGLRETLHFTLPAGASRPEFFGDLSQDVVTFHHDGFTHSQPVHPGWKQILYSYRLPFSERSIEYRAVLPYHHEEIDLFIASQEIRVSSSDLTRMGVVGGGDARYVRYSGHELEAGHEIVLRMYTPPSRTKIAPWVGVGALVVLLLIGLRGAALRRRQHALSAPHGDLAGSRQRKEELIEAIADLDERRERGEIGAEDHGHQRDRLKKLLSDIMRKMAEQ